MSQQNPATIGNKLVISAPYRGDVCVDTVEIKSTGSLVGDIRARVVKCAGRVEGNIEAAEFLAAASARIRGTVKYAIIGIMPGAILDGSTSSTGRAPAPGTEFAQNLVPVLAATAPAALPFSDAAPAPALPPVNVPLTAPVPAATVQSRPGGSLDDVLAAVETGIKQAAAADYGNRLVPTENRPLPRIVG